MMSACGLDKEKPLRVMAEAEATRIADEYAQATIKAIGTVIKSEQTDSGPAPCEGRGGEVAKDGRYYIQHLYLVTVPAGQDVPTLERLRTHWQRSGYEVTQFRTFPSGGGEAAARNGQDGYQMHITSTDTPAILSLAVYSPCLMPPGKVSG